MLGEFTLTVTIWNKPTGFFVGFVSMLFCQTSTTNVSKSLVISWESVDVQVSSQWYQSVPRRSTQDIFNNIDG